MIDLTTLDAALSAIEILQRAGNTQPQFERARRVLNLERAALASSLEAARQSDAPVQLRSRK